MTLTALTCISDFSIGESLISPDKYPELLKAAGYDSAAIMDTMTLGSMIRFTNAADKAGIKPIIGCRLCVYDEPQDKTPIKKRETPNNVFKVKVYVKNEAGLKRLYKTLTQGFSPENFYYVPRIGVRDLISLISTGDLIVTTGDFYGVFSHPKSDAIMQLLVKSAGASNLFVELSPVNTPLFDTLNAKALAYAKSRSLRTIVSYPFQYETEEDAKTLDVLSVIASNMKMGLEYRPMQQVTNFTVKRFSAIAEQSVISKGAIEAIHGKDWSERLWLKGALNSKIIAEECQYHWTKQDASLPVMDSDEPGKLLALVKEGFKRRLVDNQVLGYKPSGKLCSTVYSDRLKYELSVLNKMGFERYFLLVEELVSWSKDNGITVGPGRGSIGGSLIAFLLGITDVDPIRFGLIFERFINPDRIDLPDADLDFMSSRRREIIDHLIDTYGQAQVASVANYTTMASAGALRDTARVFELETHEYDCTKLIPKIHGQSHTLEEAAGEVPAIEAFKNARPDIWHHALKLSGVMRSMGTHAAGVVIAGEPVINRSMLDSRKGDPTVCWDKRVVEEQGLIKMDILGLSTLDVLTICANKIKQDYGKDVDLTTLPLDDTKVMQQFSAGKTKGVFQFEGGGMSTLLKNLATQAPLVFDDLVAATALYRPGPMDSGLMDDYVQIKQGLRSIIYEHPNMQAALEDTHGVIIYQESVMRIAQDLAGYSMADADKLRKIMGKKLPAEMALQRDKWVQGCYKHSGMSEIAGEQLFDKIEKFAGYGFNKSHAVAYTIISYWAMWLKVNYPAQFFASSMSVLKEEKLLDLARDALDAGIDIMPPNINRSSNTFEVSFDADGKQILYTPFNRITGISDNIGDCIIEARFKAGGSFKNYRHFFESVNKTKVNKRVQATLDKVGAFADFPNDEETREGHQKKYPHYTLDQVPAKDESRLKDQLLSMPGLVTQSLKVERGLMSGKHSKAKLLMMHRECEECTRCSLTGKVHPMPKIGRSAKIMVVTDCPNFGEEKTGEMMSGLASGYVKQALGNSGMSVADCYFTSLVKAAKDAKLTNDQINECASYLAYEISILQPQIIVALGGATIRNLVPAAKGSFSDLCGQTHYRGDIDCTVVFGINPQMIYMDGDKQSMLDGVFHQVASMLKA